jgi:ubiquinone/menaquinone biosynthesis C-methylase UbiE/acyl carrier protein
MAYQSAYKINDFSLNAQNEIDRLEAQVELFWEKELMFYKMFGLSEGMEIVECGCGTGIVGRKLLHAFPGCRITAFDIDPLLVETAKQNALRWNLKNYEVFERPIIKTELPDDKYDFAITRLVLEHLSNPTQAIEEVYRILKFGGKAIFVDNDFEFHMRTYPDLPELKDLYEAYCRARQDDGGNPKIGRQLPNLLRRSGFYYVDMHIVNAHSTIIGDNIFLKSEGSGIPAKLIKDGYLSGDLFSSIAKKWANILRSDEHSIFRQLFLCVGQKPFEPPVNYKSSPEVKTVSKQNSAPQATSLGRESNPEPITVNPIQLNDKTSVPSETKIANIWCKVLNRESVEHNENFFEAGGSSLYAVEIVELLEKEFGQRISVVDFFENPTTALFAKFINSQNQQNENISSENRKEMRAQKILRRREMIRNMRGLQNG